MALGLTIGQAAGNYTPGQYFWFLAAGLLLAQAVRGWRLGVVRQAAELVALVAGYAMAWTNGHHVAPYLQFMGLPKTLAPLAGGVVAGTGTFLIISIIAALLLKRTEHQSVGLVRLAWGFSGSLLAIAATLLVIALSVAGLRVFGTMLESRLMAETAAHLRPAHQATTQPGWAELVVDLKRELEEGPGGFLLKKLDPVPGEVYATAEKVGGLLSTPQAMERFLAQPEVKALAGHPKVLSALGDPQLRRDLQAWNYANLSKNPHVAAALEDPQVAALLQRVDWRTALEQARQATPAPTR